MTTHSALPHPAIQPRLVVGESGRRTLSLVDELALGTYADVDVSGLIGELERAGLRGRGGSGFPAHIKWRGVAAGPGPRVVVANGEEGEPASFKDRWLLTHRPHAVIDGLLLAADAVQATRAVIYLSHAETVQALQTALADLPDAVSSRVELHVVEHRYVAGEESAVCRSISGGPALPLAKPPRPFESGVDARPTLVSNVETLAHAAWIARNGAAAYRSYGTVASRGTGLATFGGACGRPGVYEVPYGPSLRDLLEDCTGTTAADAPGLLMGGWFGGVADTSVLDVAWCYDALRDAGSCLGCATVTVLDRDERLADVAARLAAWYVTESAQQCGVCRRGTAAIAQTIGRIRDDSSEPADLINLTRWGDNLRGRGACAFLDGAANLSRTFVEAHDPATDRATA